MGNLTNLRILRLSNNQLSGNIPKELKNCKYLFVFDVSRNKLSGNIPQEIGELVHMRHFNLQHNYFSGDVPASFINLVDLCVEGVPSHYCLKAYKTDFGYNLLNVPQPNPPSDFMYEKDPDWDQTQIGRRYFNYLPVIANK